MAKINLYFGGPTSEKVSDQNERCALNLEISIEKANIELFNSVMNVLIRKNEDGNTYFDLLFVCITGQDLVCPVIAYSTYEYKRTKYPKLTINRDYLVDKNSKTKTFITDEWVEKFGKFIEEDFDYEFIEFRRAGKVKLRSQELTHLVRCKDHNDQDDKSSSKPCH